MSLVPSDTSTFPRRTVPDSLFGYEIIDAVGEGAGSVIYAACRAGSNQLYAVKHVVCHSDRDRRLFEQLDNEFRIGAKVNHPGLRRSIDIHVRRTWFHKISEALLVMELFDGVSLEEQLPPGLHAIVRCFIQTAHAVHALNAMGYVHCDLKPNNVLVNTAGQVKVIDLGQACLIGRKKERIQGTPNFIAPEQVRRDAMTVRTDVFNFGASLYWSLCGRKIPTLMTADHDSGPIPDDQIPTPRSINPSVPENLSGLVMECVRSRPAKRPHGCGEIVPRLEAVEFQLVRSGQ